MIKKLFLLFILTGVSIQLSFALPDPAKDTRIQKVYESFKGDLLWIQGESWSLCANTLKAALNHVEDEGLWKEDYEPLLLTMEEMDLSVPEERKRADELLTLAALNYISDMKGERLNPRTASKSIHIKEVSIDEAELLVGYLSTPYSCTWVKDLIPRRKEYQDLKETLAHYRQKQTQGGWAQLPEGTKLEKGDQGPLVETLREQLMPQDIQVTQESDVFDEELEHAVKEYQDLHGLEHDGVVGAKTVAGLNTPVEDRIRSIIISLERQRWYPNPMPNRYIQVNVAGYYLNAVEGGKSAFFMPIITGKKYTKTPVFNAPMTEIIFNPSWHVPASIVPEILPKIQKNPEAYRRKGYVVTYGSGVRIVQRPGSGNALGKIRFTIKSPFSIYLHGTPAKKLFEKEKRAFSHGCIRVKNPVKLAQFVFNDPSWTKARIEKESSGSRTDHVKLKHSLPTFITYFTVFEDEQGRMNFVPDEYGQDEKVWKALTNERRSRNKED